MAKENSTTARRSEQILQELLRNGEVAVDKLAEQLKVSEATIRRDLSELERHGLLLRSHGGAVPVAPMLYEPVPPPLLLSRAGGGVRRREAPDRAAGGEPDRRRRDHRHRRGHDDHTGRTQH